MAQFGQQSPSLLRDFWQLSTWGKHIKILIQWIDQIRIMYPTLATITPTCTADVSSYQSLSSQFCSMFQNFWSWPPVWRHMTTYTLVTTPTCWTRQLWSMLRTTAQSWHILVFVLQSWEHILHIPGLLLFNPGLVVNYKISRSLYARSYTF